MNKDWKILTYNKEIIQEKKKKKVAIIKGFSREEKHKKIEHLFEKRNDKCYNIG